MIYTESEARATAELERYGLRCEAFTGKEMAGRKTPDRRVYHGVGLAFYLEIKEVAPDPWVGGGRLDPVLNRLTDDIHTAVKQFDSVNPSLEYPNVLAFVNNDRKCDFRDLIGVLTGQLLLDDDTCAPIYAKYAEGRIVEEKNRIHLYIWIDSFGATQSLFNPVDARHHVTLCQCFGIADRDIKIRKPTPIF